MILVLNAGSSSLKFKLFKYKKLEPICSGVVDGIGLRSCYLEIKTPTSEIQKKQRIKNHKQALQKALTILTENSIINSLTEIKAIGHRVVHGGDKYSSPTIIDRKVQKTIKKLSELAPLHNPANLQGIIACKKNLKRTPNVAVFDTAFHQTIPEHAYLYGLPYSLYKKHNIRRYGFHGINHQYVSEKLPQKKIITCHLGNGASIAAIKNGKSIETSMGFTPLEGLIMGTRCGDIDPAIHSFLIDNKRFSNQTIDELLNYESGLKGLSEISSDMRILHETSLEKKQNAPTKKALQAQRAIAAFNHRIIKYIGAYAATLNGLDALVFTAGMGERAWYLRRDICKQLTHLEVKIDNTKNRKIKDTPDKPTPIHAKSSKVKIYIIPANEELQIAKEVKKVLDSSLKN